MAVEHWPVFGVGRVHSKITEVQLLNAFLGRFLLLLWLLFRFVFCSLYCGGIVIVCDEYNGVVMLLSMLVDCFFAKHY